jgi:hypothetical protein
VSATVVRSHTTANQGLTIHAANRLITGPAKRKCLENDIILPKGDLTALVACSYIQDGTFGDRLL